MRYGWRVLVTVWALWCVNVTGTRPAIWGDERALWAEAVQHGPEKPRPWVNLGNQYAIRGAPALAEYAYREAIQRAANPARSGDEQRIGRGIAEANLARLRFEAGDLDGAVRLSGEAAARSGLESVKSYHQWLLRHAPAS